MRRTNLFALPLFALAALAACGGDGGGGDTGRLDIGMWTPSGNNQTDTVGQTLPKVIRVRVLVDSVPTAGFMVHFTGGNLGTDSILTDAFGVATSTWTLGPLAGTQFVNAELDEAIGSPVIFHATAIVGTPYAIQKVSGDSGVAAFDADFTSHPTVRSVDSLGNPVSGVWIHFSATGPVDLGADSILTGGAGTSVLNVFASPTDTGVATITASASGMQGSPIDFSYRTVPVVAEVGLAGTAYTPATVNINAGSAVRWTWNSGTHSVTSTGSPSFPSANTTASPAVFGPIYFPTPGTYTYQCQVHASMQGTIIVH